jgi:hypothetical protein
MSETQRQLFSGQRFGFPIHINFPQSSGQTGSIRAGFTVEQNRTGSGFKQINMPINIFRS